MADKLKLDRQAMKDRTTSHLRIYVGGLADKTSVDHLYEHFIPYGQINGIVINKNFGFVQFETEESAHDAISNANGSTLQGRVLNVRTAQTNSDKSRRETEVVTVTPDKPPAMVLTENMPVVVDADSEEQQYDKFGNFIGDQTYRDEEYEENSQYNRNEPRNESRGGARGRAGRGGRGRGAWGRGASGGFRERSPAGGRGNDWPERGGYDRYSHPMPEYPRALPMPEKNDCEIIVVSKQLTEYAEYIESRLKRLGIVVDLLYPMEDVPIGKVLGNIASRGCLYAILVMPQNQEHRSLTLTILHGLPQEHRNMPLEDALVLLSRNFQEVQRGGPSGREAVYALLGQLADGRALTVLQYDKVLEYLQERREQQVKLELGEPLAPAPVTTKTQVDLQQRILSILNDKAVPPAPAPSAPAPAPAPVPAPTPAPAPAQNKLLNDPTVRKALDSILQKFA